MLNTVFCEEISMKKTIYILILICVLTLLPSCGESGELQENRPGFNEKDSEAEAANSMDKPQFAAEEPDEIGVSEITEDTFAAPEYNIQDGAVRAFGEEISAAGVLKGDLVENAMTYIVTNAEIFDSSVAAGIDSSKMEEYIDYRFTDENGNLRSEVQFLLVDITIRNNEMPQELNISSLERARRISPCARFIHWPIPHIFQTPAQDRESTPASIIITHCPLAKACR